MTGRIIWQALTADGDMQGFIGRTDPKKRPDYAYTREHDQTVLVCANGDTWGGLSFWTAQTIARCHYNNYRKETAP